MAAGDPNLGRPAPTAKNDLTVNEIRAVALVPSGDNPDAEIVLVKADPRNPEASATTADVGDMPNTPSTATGQPPEGGGPEPQTDDLLKSQVAALIAQNELLAKQNEMLVKHLEEDDDDLPEGVEVFEGEDGELYYAEAGDEEVGKSDPADGDLDAFIKANPQLAEVFKAYDSQIEALTAQAQQAHAIAKAEEAARLDVQFSKRAEAFASLGMDHDEVAKTLRDCFEQCDADTYVAVEKMLAHAATILEENNGLTEEVGKSDAEGAYTTKWDEVLAKAGQDPALASLTREQQMAEAFRTNPDFYAELEAAATNGRTTR